VLDTGLFLAHPDFADHPVVSKSFITGVPSANDGHGHGTHCTGAACGPFKPTVGPRYGVAHKRPPSSSARSCLIRAVAVMAASWQG
jgi:hypothetical protein